MNYNTSRIIPKYTKMVRVPAKYAKYLWDHKGIKVPLEKYLLRMLMYGDFENVKFFFSKYPEEVHYISNQYPQIDRGVRYWINQWYKHGKKH